MLLIYNNINRGNKMKTTKKQTTKATRRKYYSRRRKNKSIVEKIVDGLFDLLVGAVDKFVGYALEQTLGGVRNSYTERPQ
jgi:hypothetical protein